jgi:hypothetical protein
MKTNNDATEQWWTSLSTGEKDLIRALIRLVRSAKHSQVTEVSRAARKWDSALSFFFKLRLQNQRRRWQISHGSLYPGDHPAHRDFGRPPISYPSNARIQQGASPGRG